MRNDLPEKLLKKKCAIVNLDSNSGDDTHWVACKKRYREISYFNSFGDLKQPKELIKYFGENSIIFYNGKKYQSFKSNECGLYRVTFLKNQL